MVRHCGGCTLCCTITRVPEHNKRENTPCPFCDRGCTIYKDRPKSCRDFECAWLKGDLPRSMRPDKVHVMIEHLPGVNVVAAIPEKGHEDTWDTPEVIRQLNIQYIRKGIGVYANKGRVLAPPSTTAKAVAQDFMVAAKRLGVIR